MKPVSNHCDVCDGVQVLTNAEERYGIKIRDDIKEFLGVNSGGYPLKDIIKTSEDEYEVRVFLSLNRDNANYYIEKPLDYFLNNTKGKIIPIGLDSGDNYYCANNETGKIYYWSASDNQYYYIAESLEKFAHLFGHT